MKYCDDFSITKTLFKIMQILATIPVTTVRAERIDIEMIQELYEIDDVPGTL